MGSNGWQRAEKVGWVYIPTQGCGTEEVYPVLKENGSLCRVG